MIQVIFASVRPMPLRSAHLQNCLQSTSTLSRLKFLIWAARPWASKNLGDIAYWHKQPSLQRQQTSIESHYASNYLYLHLQSSRLTPHSHISLPSLAVNSFALYAAELTSRRMPHSWPHCLSSSARLRLASRLSQSLLRGRTFPESKTTSFLGSRLGSDCA